MLILRIPAQVLGTNCYVVSQTAGEECVIIDPGVGLASILPDVLAKYRLRPAAILLTHGHLDHSFSVTPLSSAAQVAVTVHTEDAHLLTDPLAGLDPVLASMLDRTYQISSTWKEPTDIRMVTDNTTIDVAGLPITVKHAPGHTAGSVLFGMAMVPDSELIAEAVAGTVVMPTATLLTGDVLFAGGIGRTDLPGGDDLQMQQTLRNRVLTQSDDVLVLPGHGLATTIGRERHSNPYLQQAGSPRLTPKR